MKGVYLNTAASCNYLKTAGALLVIQEVHGYLEETQRKLSAETVFKDLDAFFKLHYFKTTQLICFFKPLRWFMLNSSLGSAYLVKKQMKKPCFPVM